MDAIELLTRDHRDVEDLFERMSVTDNEGLRRELLERLATALTLHAISEEQHFYPAARDGSTDALLRSFFHDHDQVKRNVAQLLDLDVTDEEFDDKLEALRRDIEGHVAEEEQELFPRVRSILSREILIELAEEMSATREGLKEIEPREELDPDNASAPI